MDKKYIQELEEKVAEVLRKYDYPTGVPLPELIDILLGGIKNEIHSKEIFKMDLELFKLELKEAKAQLEGTRNALQRQNEINAAVIAELEATVERQRKVLSRLIAKIDRKTKFDICRWPRVTKHPVYIDAALAAKGDQP